MTRIKILSAGLIAAAMLATPATARQSHASSRHLTENANASTAPRARYVGEVDRFRGYESRDMWGHWGTYYGPMVP
jgi:hypothetical protein